MRGEEKISGLEYIYYARQGNVMRIDCLHVIIALGGSWLVLCDESLFLFFFMRSCLVYISTNAGNESVA